MIGTFYGIGIGPGEAELITLKGYRILKEADFIFVPKARVKSKSLAREIVEEIIDEKKCFIEIEFPMTNDKLELEKKYKHSAKLIYEKICNGGKGVYLTIGDPLLFSTYIYLIEALKKETPALQINTIPGVAAYSALAAKFNYSLGEKDEKICIYPLTTNDDELKNIILNHDTIVIMKAAKQVKQVIQLLNSMNLTEFTIFGSRVGQKNEKLIDGRVEPIQISENQEYMSTIIVRNRKK